MASRKSQRRAIRVHRCPLCEQIYRDYDGDGPEGTDTVEQQIVGESTFDVTLFLCRRGQPGGPKGDHCGGVVAVAVASDDGQWHYVADRKPL